MEILEKEVMFTHTDSINIRILYLPCRKIVIPVENVSSLRQEEAQLHQPQKLAIAEVSEDNTCLPKELQDTTSAMDPEVGTCDAHVHANVN